MQRLSDKLLSWASILDDETRRQAELTATLPIVHPHVALMPDAHREGNDRWNVPSTAGRRVRMLRAGRAS